MDLILQLHAACAAARRCLHAASVADDSVATTQRQQQHPTTTRQTFQIRDQAQSADHKINKAMIDSIGSCGDVSRNVLYNPIRCSRSCAAEVYRWARKSARRCCRKPYHEIWLDGERIKKGRQPNSALADTYLPRKFKTAVAIPPATMWMSTPTRSGFCRDRRMDQAARIQRLLAGGGVGTTHGDTSTFPAADELGFVAPTDYCGGAGGGGWSSATKAARAAAAPSPGSEYTHRVWDKLLPRSNWRSMSVLKRRARSVSRARGDRYG